MNLRLLAMTDQPSTARLDPTAVLAAVEQAKDEAFEAALKTGEHGVLVLMEDDGADITVGAHSGVGWGRTDYMGSEPDGEFLQGTVRRFRLNAA